MRNTFSPRADPKWVGTQQAFTWTGADVEPRPILQHDDAGSGFQLHRLEVWGENAQAIVSWGTSKDEQILVDLPFCATVPGKYAVTGVPTAPNARVSGAAVQVTSAGSNTVARRLVTGAATLARQAVSFFALTACTVTVGGTAVAVPALSRVLLVPGSTIAPADVGFEEFEF